MKCVVFGLDGTLVDTSRRRLEPETDAYDPALLKLDVAIGPMVRLCRLLCESDSVLIVSNRPERVSELTRSWLGNNFIRSSGLFLRQNKDDHTAAEYKLAMLEYLMKDGYKPWLAIDSDATVVDAYRQTGLQTLLAG